MKIEYIDITPEEFKNEIKKYEDTLTDLFKDSSNMELEIIKQLKTLKYD